jgi:hypothetical protein
LASAYLDDAVDDDERARVESSPDLLARVDRLKSVRRAVAAVPAVDVAQRETHITHALAALDVAEPISLADRRNRRSSRRLAWLSAAAAVVVVAGVLAVMANRSDHGSLSTAGSATTTTAAGDTAIESQAGGAKSDAQAPATTAAAGATTTMPASAAYSTTTPTRPAVAPTDTSYLGSIDANSAAAVLRGASDRRLQGPPACSVPAGTHYIGDATYAGAPVFAFVTEAGGSPPRGVLLDVATCTVVADLPLT